MEGKTHVMGETHGRRSTVGIERDGSTLAHLVNLGGFEGKKLD